MVKTFSQLGFGKSLKVEQLVQLETDDIAEEISSSDGLFVIKVRQYAITRVGSWIAGFFLQHVFNNRMAKIMTSLLSQDTEKDLKGLWNAISNVVDILFKHVPTVLLQRTCYAYSMALLVLGKSNIFASFSRVRRQARQILDQIKHPDPDGNFCQRYLAYYQQKTLCQNSPDVVKHLVENQIVNFLFVGKGFIILFWKIPMIKVSNISV